MSLEVYSYRVGFADCPPLQSGAVDAIIAGMSPTAEREEQVDFTDCLLRISNLVVIIQQVSLIPKGTGRTAMSLIYQRRTRTSSAKYYRYLLSAASATRCSLR